MPPHRRPPDDVLERLEKQKEVYARALRNTTRELESRIEELGLLRQLGQLFERSTRLEDVASHALPMLLRSSEADNASIMLLSPASGQLDLVAAAGRTEAHVAYYGPGGYPERLFREGEGLAGACVAEGRAILAEEAGLEPRFLPGVGRISVGSLACIPLSVHDKPLGVLNLSHRAPGGLDAQRMPGWAILASYLAIAVSHALLFQELKESNRKAWERVRARTRSLEQANRELQQAKAEIARHNEQLQQRVAERTRELETALAQLQAQHTRLEEAHRVKDEFLNNINHELKTPLNAIIGYAGLLLRETEGALSPEQRADLELIEANGKHLQQILENIFSLKDIERGAVELDRQATDVNELVQSAVATLRPRARDKSIEIVFEPLDIPPALVDPTLIRRVLFNLLDNAVKFSREGRVAVRTFLSHRDPGRPEAERSPDEGGKPYAVVEVEDQGKGIRPEDLERIFQKFQQGEPPTRKAEGGSGLGLTIAKTLVELHGGRVWVTSTPGKGSRFAFCLPLEP
ncbi:MAG: hypothetical protein Kow0092_17550 [Deferrisomatales bacterium]